MIKPLSKDFIGLFRGDYLADSLVRLKEESLKKKIDGKNREEKINNLNKELGKYENKDEKKLLDNKSEHEKRVNEILGY